MSNISLYVNKAPVDVVFDRFPAGETLVRIIDNGARLHMMASIPACIKLDFKSNGDLIDLMLVVDALRRFCYQPVELSLVMDYLPYARQDRVCNVGESLSVKVIADLINSLNFTRVFCKDIHSDVGAALINNLVHIDQTVCANRVLHILDTELVLASPDAGANKKVLNFAKKYGIKEVVRADKIRNVLTGDIVETKVYSEHVGNKDFLILDDICDGGRTFIELAKELRKLTDGKIYLYVTHGIFSKGAEVFEGILDGIFTSNLMGQPHNLIKEI